MKSKSRRRPEHVVVVLALLGVPGNSLGQAPTAGKIYTNDNPRHLSPEPQAAAMANPDRLYTLPQLIDTAERNNPQSRTAWEEAKQAAEQVGIARADLFPVLSFETLALKGDLLFGLPPNLSSEGVVKINSVIIEPSVRLAWTVFDFGGNRAAYDRAKYLALAQKMALNETNERVALQVYKAYSSLLTAKTQLLSAQASGVTSQSILDSVETRFNTSLASDVDLADARAQQRVSLARLVKAEADTRNARVDLAFAVGLHDGEGIDIPTLDRAPTPAAIAGSARDFVQQALAKRPDLIEAADEMKAAQYQVKQARSLLYPKITFDASEQYTHTSNTPAIGGAAGAAAQTAATEVNGNTYVVAGHLTLNLFDAGARRDRLRQTQSQAREAGDRLDGLRLEAEKDVWSAYTTVMSAAQDEDAGRATLEAAKLSYDATNEGYHHGTKQLIDLEQAEQKLVTADSAYQAARAQTLQAAAQLSFTVGDLMEAGPRFLSQPQGGR